MRYSTLRVHCWATLPLILAAGCASDPRISANSAPVPLAAVVAPDTRLLPRLTARQPVTTPPSLIVAPAMPRAAAEQLARTRAMLAEGIRARISGEATYYADYFDGRRTASGIVFRQTEFWAAHRHYPFGTRLRVTNLRNSRVVEVRVVDRGPFGAAAARRNTIIDLSRAAARELRFLHAGRTPVRIEVLEWGEQ